MNTGFRLPIEVLFGGRGYRLLQDVSYHSPRYKKSLSKKKGWVYDGATGVPDIQSFGPLVHDIACERGTWDDGTPITNLQASMVLRDIMLKEGRGGGLSFGPGLKVRWDNTKGWYWGRANTWFLGTLIFRPISNLPRYVFGRK